MTRILQRRKTVWGGGENRETVEAEKRGHEEGSQQHSNQCDSPKEFLQMLQSHKMNGNIDFAK